MNISKFGNDYLIKIYKEEIKDIDIYDIDDIYTLIKLIIKKKIKNNNISGNYQINIYTNDIYGMIIEFNKIKENSYIDLKINITIDSIFLYKTNSNYLNTNNTIYYYKNNYYILPKDNNINLLEVEEVLYGSIVKEILSNGIKVKLQL